MAETKTVSLLERLLSGTIDIPQFREQLSDVLFQLRQDLAPSVEKAALSRIQLHLHEFDEGIRDIHEVYMAAQVALALSKPPANVVCSRLQMMPPAILPSNVVPTTSSPRPKVVVPLAQPGTVVPTTSSPHPEFSELPTLIPL